MPPLWHDPEHCARITAHYRARYLRRRALWRAAGKDPRRYRELAEQATAGYLFPYEFEDPDEIRSSPDRTIWRQLAHDVCWAVWACGVIAFGVWISDFLW